MCLAQGPQRSDASEARPIGPSSSSQALYHWATALPTASNLILFWDYSNNVNVSLAASQDFQQCGMCDQQKLRPACAYAQSYQSLY